MGLYEEKRAHYNAAWRRRNSHAYLIKNYILKYFGASEDTHFEVYLEALDDAAVVGDIVLKSDSYAVKPIFGLGAEPQALACGFILEEGLSLTDFEKILVSMRQTCREANVSIVAGDTRVVEKGS